VRPNTQGECIKGLLGRPVHDVVIGHGQIDGFDYRLICGDSDFALGPGVAFVLNGRSFRVCGWDKASVWVFEWLNNNWVSKEKASGDYLRVYEHASPHISDLPGFVAGGEK
jgi:hypothetical protein